MTVTHGIAQAGHVPIATGARDSDGNFGSEWGYPQSWNPADNGLVACNADLNAISATSTMVAGTIYVIRMPSRAAISWTTLCFMLNGSGSGASSGSFIAPYDSGGNQLAS